MNFEDLNIKADVVKAMREMGWNEPTPIQTEAVPAGISGKDLMAQAQTGTGKTGAYASIMLSRVEPMSRKPSALILAPTRELAGQIDEEIYKLSKYSGHTSVTVYGGASIDNQIRNIRKGRDIVVGTPGRMKDLLSRDALDLSHVSVVILDEADRMLDMGFARELNFIMDHVPKERQTLLFSATMAREVKGLAQNYMKRPVEISVSKDEICSDLTEQHFMTVTKGDKQMVLGDVLDRGLKTIVFVKTKRSADRICKNLKEDYKVGVIHGDIPQGKREKAIKSYRDDVTDVLIATDVAARGLDVNNIGCVVNYDIPNDVETYLHRIGRTGRAGSTGMAISFVTREEMSFLKACERETKKPISRIGVNDIVPGKKVPAKTVVETVTEKPAVKMVQKHQKYPEGMVSLQINLGRADNLNRSDISELVKRNVGLESSSVGRVGLGQSSSYVEVHCDHVNRTLDALTGFGHKGKKLFVSVAPIKAKYKDLRPAAV